MEENNKEIENNITHYIKRADTLRAWHWIRRLIEYKEECDLVAESVEEGCGRQYLVDGEEYVMCGDFYKNSKQKHICHICTDSAESKPTIKQEMKEQIDKGYIKENIK